MKIPSMGATPAGKRLARIEASPNYRDGAFQNPVPTAVTPSGTMGRILKRQLFGKEQRTPPAPLPVRMRDRASFDPPPPSGLRITWLGHSSTLVEIDGFRILIDPVFGKRTSPSQLMGPARFHPAPVRVEDLPPLDAIIITHDHYDHLDYGVVRALARGKSQPRARWITALGVGAHLERWGIPSGSIEELDWGDAAHVGALKITAQPARHFSGRGIKRNQTLWASWVIAGPKHRVFNSGDTGWYDGLAAIGERHGPFDVTMIKIGAYDVLWPDIHVNPEEALRFHGLLGGTVMLPLHWGTFNLALHPWDEPAERVVAEAERLGVKLALPIPGGSFEPSLDVPASPWWRGVTR